MERNTYWEIGFDNTRNGICVWTLGCHNQMNTGGTRLLCNSLNAHFNLFTRHSHQICDLINYYYNIWHIRQIDFLGFKQQFTCFLVCANGNLLSNFLTGLALGGNNFIITLNITRINNLQLFITFFHFTHRPFQCVHSRRRI